MMKLLIAAAAGFAAGCLLVPAPAVTRTETRVLTRIDTVRVTMPEIVVIRALESVPERLALVSDSTDSADVRVPVEQSVYEGEAYRAVVSGHMARLDTVEIFQPVTTVVSTKAVNRRVSVGLQGGYGITPRGFQPYVGVGVTVRLL